MSASTATPSFRIARRALDLRFRFVRLAARQWLTPAYVRVRLEGADLRDFDSPGCDDHVRVFFPEVAPESIDEMRAAPSREYTPLSWDADEGWLDLEFALHGDGVAAEWAATAEVGSTIGIGGPRGSAVLTGRPDGWFLAGDETAVPAIRRFAHHMDAVAVGRVLIEVPDAEHELPIATPPGVVVEQVHRGSASAGVALAARLDALGDEPRPGGAIFGFVAAEQSIVRSARALLIERWRLDPEQITVKGYWKRGEPEYHAPH
ncbi:siderophore-interacting protein [Microbacterium arborescens]|uniref:siderophore-interacting protein n=1 Tax=Microbacterium arborescens TaxID=33883 RepID=UPI0025A16F20|nr:siderophore-interacting protein [Microbacterium arborescens]WJM16396.1 siderophore-interacting protein [Microbacterium arborescens]